jgi:hypothetical protein
VRFCVDNNSGSVEQHQTLHSMLCMLALVTPTGMDVTAGKPVCVCVCVVCVCVCVCVLCVYVCMCVCVFRVSCVIHCFNVVCVAKQYYQSVSQRSGNVDICSQSFNIDFHVVVVVVVCSLWMPQRLTFYWST